jgi:two-component system cell cycle sensor histidine kinase/response regulator CckA
MKKSQILIVEDELIVADDIKTSLIRLGYDVCGMVVSGKEAIKKAKEIRPDLVLMDIVLKEEMNGIEAASLIRSRFHIPVVYLTAHSDNKTLKRAKIAEPFGYIRKPVEQKELKTAMEIALYRYEIERRLKESEERYRTLYEESRDALYITTREGKIVDINQSMLDLFGYTREEMIGMNIRKNCINPANRIRFQKQIEKNGFVRDYEIKLRNKEEKELDCLITATVRRASDGRILGYQGSIRDITERKRTEEEKEKLQAQLIHSEKMAGIGTLASGIAHEFNNLLQIMRGYVEFAQKTKRQKDIEEALDIVIHNADRATKIIKDLLTFSRHEVSGKEQSDIIESIESVLSLTEDQLRKHNIEVIREYRIIPPIRINKTELQQVFLNMVTNARDAMLPKGGILRIDVSQNSENVEIRFCDSGRGIAQENLGKIFEPFFTTKGAAGADSELRGTGLGLSVSYGIVKKHGGAIEVESKTGSGTTFTVKLPAKEE